MCTSNVKWPGGGKYISQCLVHYWCARRKKKKVSFLSIGNARKWLKRNSHTRGLLPSRQVTGKHLPFPPPTPLPWFFFLPSTTLLSTSPIHSLPFSMPLFPSPSLLCLLKHKCFKFRFQNEWRVTSKVTVNEWLLPVMVSRHTTYHATARMHTHTHTQWEASQLDIAVGWKQKRVSFLGNWDSWSTWQLRVPFCHGGVGAH